MKQNNSLNNNFILLFDSSMSFEDVYATIKEKKPKIITFDYESHKLFEEKNISHEISDVYLSQNDLDHIQDKSYLFAHWFDKPEISNLLHYDEINIGELFYYDFFYQLVPILKKFMEIEKIFESNKKSTFITSSTLYEIITFFTTLVVQLKINKIKPENSKNVVKLPITFGKFLFSIKIKYNHLKKINSFLEKLLLAFLPHDSSNPKNDTVLLIDFTTLKYKSIFKILHEYPINLVKFDRIMPTVWNFESYSIIKNSNCLVENYTSLIDRSLKNSIASGILLFKNKTNLLWQQNKLFNSIFTLNDKSLWKVIKPILVKQYEKTTSTAISEIELTKKLFKKYNFNSILVWSETNMNHLIAIKLAKKQNIQVNFIQHGLYFDNAKTVNFNKFVRIIPEYADKFFVWGNFLKQHVMGLGFAEQNIEVIGSPLHDDIFIDKIKNTLHENEFILLATSSPHHNIVEDLTVKIMQNYLESIKKICEIVTKLDKKLVIKLHPHPDEYDITDLVKKIDSRIIVIKAGDITPLIKLCEVFIVTDISTTILEAQILGKPVISFKIRDYLGISEMKKLNPCFSVTQDNFEEILIQILTNNKFNLDCINRGFEFSQNYISNEGFASKHLLDSISHNDVVRDTSFN